MFKCKTFIICLFSSLFLKQNKTYYCAVLEFLHKIKGHLKILLEIKNAIFVAQEESIKIIQICLNNPITTNYFHNRIVVTKSVYKRRSTSDLLAFRYPHKIL